MYAHDHQVVVWGWRAPIHTLIQCQTGVAVPTYPLTALLYSPTGSPAGGTKGSIVYTRIIRVQGNVAGRGVSNNCTRVAS